jgi:hypothetical protein
MGEGEDKQKKNMILIITQMNNTRGPTKTLTITARIISIFNNISYRKGIAIAQAVSDRVQTAAARIQTVSSFGI